MSLTELSLNIPTDHVANVFGQFDAYIKKIERTLNVTVVLRGESMKLLGEEHNLKKAEQVFLQLIELSNTIIFWRIASTYAFCPSVFGLTGLPLIV